MFALPVLQNLLSLYSYLIYLILCNHSEIHACSFFTPDWKINKYLKILNGFSFSYHWFVWRVRSDMTMFSKGFCSNLKQKIFRARFKTNRLNHRKSKLKIV